MQKTRRLLLLAAVASTVVLPVQVKAVPATALVLNGTQQLVNFDTATPGTIIGSQITISNITAGQTLVGIDYRPLDSVLIGLGYNSTTGAASVYSISATGALTSINTLTLATGITRLTMDFNPTANAIRVVTSAATSNNLRIPTGGTGALATDTDLNPANTGIRAIAYSRNNAGGGTNGATTLYEVDGTNLITQGSVDFSTSGGTSPNSGTLTTVAALTGVTGSTVVGFDIFNAAGTAATSPGNAFLATNTGTFSTLILTSAAATTVGTIGGTYTSVQDIAVVPEPGSVALLAGAAAGLLGLRRRRQI